MKNNVREYDLRELINELVERYPMITSIALFGSRNFGTQSDRSDVDLILQHNSHIKPVELRNLTQELCPALDLFLCRDNIAVSCANESSVSANTYDDLIEQLQAVTLWTKINKFNTNHSDWLFKIPVGINFEHTAARLSIEQYNAWAPRIRDFMADVEESGFPTIPFIGVTAGDVASSLVNALQGAVGELSTLDNRGKSSQLGLRNEYDFQNLFHLVCKSWLPGIAREEVIITYDGQDKSADFSFLKNQIVFEFKHIRDANTKATVAKTLSGLTEFYTTHTNISVLVNVVLVDKSVKLDDRRWESDYSYRNNSPEVWTKVISNCT